MRYILMIRSRPFDDLFQKHETFMHHLRGVNNGWGLTTSEWPAVKDPGTLPVRQVNLSKHFPKGIKALVSYQNRKYYRDAGMFDDYFTLEFNPRKHNYGVLVSEIFNNYVDWFGAYRGDIKDENLIAFDFDRASEVDYRSGIYRLSPVCFFDVVLCARSFQMSLEEVRERVTEYVEKVTINSRGILIVASSEVLAMNEAIVMGDRLKALLVTGASESEK